MIWKQLKISIMIILVSLLSSCTKSTVALKNDFCLTYKFVDWSRVGLVFLKNNPDVEQIFVDSADNNAVYIKMCRSK
jgi:hypothetical protein